MAQHGYVKKLYWRHVKIKGKKFTGHYFWSRKDREFILKCGKMEKSFESHEAAKKLGWYKK